MNKVVNLFVLYIFTSTETWNDPRSFIEKDYNICRFIGFINGEGIPNYRHASNNNQDNSDTLKVTSMSKENPSKSSMEELPSSRRSLRTEPFSSGHFEKNPNLDKPRAPSYIDDSNKFNRGLNHVSILMVGSSGVGKSSTINHLLNIGAEEKVQFAKTSSTTSKTKTTKEFLAFPDDPGPEVKNPVLGIVDTPGFNDTNGLRQDACNVYSIRKFYESHPKLENCLPNLILVVVPATDTRIIQENSNLSKSLRCLNELNVVDHSRSNVVAVLSFCCSVFRGNLRRWEKEMESKKKVVRDVIFDALKVNAPVVLLENDFEGEELEQYGDLTKLPNGELQPKNLYDACQNVLRKNKDNLGLVIFNACFLKLSNIRNDGHEITAKDASKDSLSKEEEEFVNHFEQVARGREDFIFDSTQQFIQSKNLDDKQKQELMELASSLKWMGLRNREDCASVTLGTVQYFHTESISPTGKRLLEEKFGILAKAANLDSGRLIGQGYNILNDKCTPIQIMNYKTKTTDFGLVIPTCAKFEKVIETCSFMDQFESDSEYVQSRLSKLSVGLDVECGMFNMEARAGLNKTQNASSDSSVTEYSFLYEERMFEVKMANFKDYVEKGIEFTSDFVSAVNELPESYDKDDIENREDFERFFNQFGHFIVTAAFGGGSVETRITSQQHKSHAMSFKEVKACLKESFCGGYFNVGGEISGAYSRDTEAKSRNMLSQSTVLWKGGRRDLRKKDTITNQDAMTKWQLSLAANPTMLNTEMCLQPISTVISCVDPKKDKASYNALKDLLRGQFKMLASKEREREEENRRREDEARKKAEEATIRINATNEPDPSTRKDCFPSNAIVYIKDVTGNIKRKQMGNLSIGDRVRACDTKSRRIIYSEVIMFAHRDPSVRQVYLKIVLEDASSIVLSSNHLIMSGERMKATMARNIKVDHMLFTINEEGVISSKKVVAIEEIIDYGVFCPITKEGNVVVNNILASCYVSVNDQTFFNGLFKVSAESLAHLGLLPMRVLHKFRVKWVSQSVGKDQFLHPYVRWLCKLKPRCMDGELDLPSVS